MPLAVYREVVAHLCLIEGINAELQPRSAASDPAAQPFDYTLSQIECLWLEHPEHLNPADRAQIQRILAYYGDRYGAWERLKS
jgi:hypothetical protein